MTKDRSTGVIALVFGIITAIMTSCLSDSSIAGDVGPKVFPYIASGTLIVCGLGLIISGRRRAEPFMNKAQIKRMVLIFAVLIVYVIAMRFIGFLVPTLLVLFALCTMLQRDKKIAVWKRALFAVAVTALIFIMFTRVLSLRLPQGIWF